MRLSLVPVTAAAFAIAFGSPGVAAVKKVSYPEVKVEITEAYKPDAAFEKLRAAFTAAVAKKDAQALTALVGPTFVWTSQGGPSDQFDMGREALHNFKVVFGFRDVGKDTDGGVANGPFWDTLAAFAADATYYHDAGNLVCGPISAGVQDEKVFEQAKQKIGADDSVDWYFTLAETAVTTTPAGGAPVGRVGKIALPVLNVYPSAPEGQPAPAATHLEVLLPTGKSGWIPLAAVRPFVTDRLCYAVTPQGEWKIVAFDQSE